MTRRTTVGMGAVLVAGFCIGVVTTRAAAAVQSRGTIGQALAVAPDHYTLEFENDFVRVTRIKYGAHAKAPMHAHTAPGGVIVALTDQDARVTGPDGSTRELHYKAGQVRWSVATPGADSTTFSAHAEENLSDKSFELIRIDPKVR